MNPSVSSSSTNARVRRAGKVPAASAWLISLALHVALLAGASLLVFGELREPDEELVFKVDWVPAAPLVVQAPQAPEPPREVRVSEEIEPQPELVVAALPEPIVEPAPIVEPLATDEPVLADDPRTSAPLTDASAEIALALSADWTPRPGSRANGGVGVGSSGASSDADPRGVSGLGEGKLEGAGSGSVPVEPPKAPIAGDGVVPRAPVLVLAQLIENPRPAYPRASLRLGEEGSVVLRLHVEADGLVGAVEILESSGFPRLDEAAAAGVKSWRFRPATRDGVAIASLAPHRVTFRLSEAP